MMMCGVHFELCDGFLCKWCLLQDHVRLLACLQLQWSPKGIGITNQWILFHCDHDQIVKTKDCNGRTNSSQIVGKHIEPICSTPINSTMFKTGSMQVHTLNYTSLLPSFTVQGPMRRSMWTFSHAINMACNCPCPGLVIVICNFDNLCPHKNLFCQRLSISQEVLPHFSLSWGMTTKRTIKLPVEPTVLVRHQNAH